MAAVGAVLREEAAAMSQDWSKKFYSSAAWKRCRDSFIAERIRIDGGLCQDCHDKLGEIAHHWPQPLTAVNINNPEVSLNHKNLRWVCRQCHDKYPGHGVGKSILPLLQFDEDGNPIPPLKKS